MTKPNPSTAIVKAVLFCIFFTAIFILCSLAKSLLSPGFERWTHGIIGTIVALLTTWFFLAFDKKRFTTIGLQWERSSLLKFIAGIGMGIVLMGILLAGVVLNSGFRVELNPGSNIGKFLWLSLPLVPLAFLEELGFRAYPLVTIKEAAGKRTAILLTALLFGLYHIANGWTLQSALLGAGVWGIVFASVAVYSNGIAMSTGLHYAVNLTTSAFGISNQGFNLWTMKQPNGGSLENYQSSALADLVPQLVLLVAGVVLMEWVVRRKR